MNNLLVEQLKDIYDAENRLTKAIPKLAKKAANEDLRTALQEHLAETQEQVSRLEEVFEHLGERAKAKPCAGMRGIIEEGNEHVGEDYDDDDLRDAVIIGSAQRVEHYEIAAYGTAIAHARLLGLDEVVNLLEQTLEEEKNADKKLTEIAESHINLEAATGDEGDAEEDEARPSSSRRMTSASSRTRATAASRPKNRNSGRRR
jgi:ferritin-like metal-binding protein YciE